MTPSAHPRISILAAVASVILAGASSIVQAAGDPGLKVVCTTGMIADVTTIIAGDRASVQGLMGTGVDPHLYKPTRTDILAIVRADIVFYNGLLLEGKMTNALVRAAAAGRMVRAVTELLDEEYLLEPPEFLGHHDPHVWMDPVAWAESAKVIRDGLIELDPVGEAGYRERAAGLLERIDELDAYARRVLASVPESQRVLVTAHDAFNYFGRRYGFEVVGIQGISTESEAGVKDLERIVQLLADRGIGAVFTESTVSRKNISALIAGARARGHPVVIGGSLFSDAMGRSGTYEGTYLGMIDHNVTLIARALSGDAPASGLWGLTLERSKP